MSVDEALHNAGLDLVLDRRKRVLSPVDAVSFITMRQRKVGEAFAFDLTMKETTPHAIRARLRGEGRRRPALCSLLRHTIATLMPEGA